MKTVNRNDDSQDKNISHHAHSKQVEAFWRETEDLAVKEEILAQDSLQRLANCSLDEMILLFRHYRLFTIRHIDDLSVVLGRLPFGKLKAFFSKVLYEEFGMETAEGFDNNHVNLLDSFIVSLGSTYSYCQDPTVELSSNVELLDNITERVQNAPLPFAIGLRGMGTECLCQVYLTAIFDLVEKNPNFKKHQDVLDLRFESLHRGEVEKLHRIHMRQRIADLINNDPEQLPILMAGYEMARESFHDFFANIYQHIDEQLELETKMT
jgi:hypothetical protein